MLLKTKSIGTNSDLALLLDFQATLETKPEKAIKLEKDALAQIETITADNARLVSNIHANLGGLYRMNSYPDLAREHMEKSISLLDQFNLLHINDSIPQIANYAMFLTEQQEPERGISELQKLSGIIKEYHSDHCLDYAKVQETLGTIYLMTANLPQAKTHFKRAFKIYEKIWADEPVSYTHREGVENSIEEVKNRLLNIRQQKISEENVYQFLLYFDKLYDKFTDLEKKEFLNSFVERVDIYEQEQPDGRFLKHIKFRFPVYFGDRETQELYWDNESTVETVALLSADRSGTETGRQ